MVQWNVLCLRCFMRRWMFRLRKQIFQRFCLTFYSKRRWLIVYTSIRPWYFVVCGQQLSLVHTAHDKSISGVASILTVENVLFFEFDAVVTRPRWKLMHRPFEPIEFGRVRFGRNPSVRDRKQSETYSPDRSTEHRRTYGSVVFAEN